MEKIYDIMITFAECALIIVFFTLLINGIFRNKNKKVRYIADLICNSFLLIVFIVAFLFDNIFNLTISDEIFYDDIIYYFLIGISFVFDIIFGILLINTKDYIGAKKEKKKIIYTVNKKDEYIYVIYKNGNNLFLLKDTNSGIKIKLDRMTFADDAVKKVNDSFNFNISDYNRCGIVTCKGENIDTVYHCYLIEIKDILLNEAFNICDLSYLPNLEINDLDRFIIYKSLMEDNFNEQF